MPIPVKKKAPLPKTAKERIYFEMRNWIINGTLKENEKISEQEIAKFFSVSRTPVREAFQMLADQKLIDLSSKNGAKVSPINLSDAKTNYQLIAELHALALELAYPKLTKADLINLREIDQSFSIAERRHDTETSEILDDQFHNFFLDLSGNPFFKEFSDTLKIHILRIEKIYYKQYYTVSFESHEKIIRALESHQLEEAKNAMRENWMHTILEVQKLQD